MLLEKKIKQSQLSDIKQFFKECDYLQDHLCRHTLENAELKEFKFLSQFYKNQPKIFIQQLAAQHKHLHFEKAFSNLETLFQECTNAEVDFLDLKPEIKAGFEALELLKKMEKFISVPTNSIGFNSQFEVEIKSILSKLPVDEVVS
jgi:hypothetical protein